MTAATTATATAIDNFGKTLKQHAAKKVGDFAELLDQIEKVKIAKLAVYEEDKVVVFLRQRAKALNVLINNFFVAKLSSQYPLLSNEIFDLKRHLYVKGNMIVRDSTVAAKMKAVHIETPLFIHVPVDTEGVEIGKYRQRIPSRWRDGSYDVETTKLSVAVPIVPPEVAELGRKALGFYHGIVAEIYHNPIISDLYSVEASPVLETMWIPTSESIGVEVEMTHVPAPKRIDPALLLKHRDRYYLIGMWDIKDELPFENTLREFTVGPAEFPKKVK